MTQIDKKPNKKWQVVIPKAIRDEWGVDDPKTVFVSFVVHQGKVQLKPRRNKTFLHLVGSLNGKADPKYADETFDETIENAWMEDIEKSL
jgi:bifunctional DNA-binding transcriptional regulator/antitoxin component of YhaV-PrlF toxin-antitoxin module